jgi:hypothetical protein
MQVEHLQQRHLKTRTHYPPWKWGWLGWILLWILLISSFWRGCETWHRRTWSSFRLPALRVPFPHHFIRDQGGKSYHLRLETHRPFSQPLGILLPGIQGSEKWPSASVSWIHPRSGWSGGRKDLLAKISSLVALSEPGDRLGIISRCVTEQLVHSLETYVADDNETKPLASTNQRRRTVR